MRLKTLNSELGPIYPCAFLRFGKAAQDEFLTDSVMLRIVLIKPSKYSLDGYVERFKKGFMPNATLYHIASLTPLQVNGIGTSVHIVDEYVRTDLEYMRLLHGRPGDTTLIAVVGVQSHQFHRALDLCAYAKENGAEHCVIGGPHPMTCDTEILHASGISFSLAEAEIVWKKILDDAVSGALKPIYGSEQRWEQNLLGPIIDPPSEQELSRYWAPMLGLYPVRGCPYSCSFCSVIKISGQCVRSPPIETTLSSLRRAKAAGVRTVMFVSDNFNKFPEVFELLDAMSKERLGLKFFCQCDTQVEKQPELIEALARAGCFEVFVGVESFSKQSLAAVRKMHNHPNRYRSIVDMCKEAGIRPHLSNIVGFPEETADDVKKHLEILKDTNPTVASFYVLTPIPGTAQYDEYLAKGVIHELNLDRYDATRSTWHHPNLSGEELHDLLYYCYKNFYTALIRKGGLKDEDLDLAIFNRYMASQRYHPMSGGIERVMVDTVKDYIRARKRYYGYEQVPLPNSLKLSEKDIAFNTQKKWNKRRDSPAPPPSKVC